MKQGLLFAFGLILGLLSCSAAKCEIAFRLDDVQVSWMCQAPSQSTLPFHQEYWITEAQRLVVDRFMAHNIPLTLGIIAGSVNTGDMAFANYLRNATKNQALIQIGCHGWLHLDFTTLTLQQQSLALSNW